MCPIVLKSGSLNLLEPSGPVEACNGIALPLPFTRITQLVPNITAAAVRLTAAKYKPLNIFCDDHRFDGQCEYFHSQHSM
jgi:hypothetical protein